MTGYEKSILERVIESLEYNKTLLQPEHAGAAHAIDGALALVREAIKADEHLQKVFEDCQKWGSD
jgi:hypothetical protein